MKLHSFKQLQINNNNDNELNNLLFFNARWAEPEVEKKILFYNFRRQHRTDREIILTTWWQQFWRWRLILRCRKNQIKAITSLTYQIEWLWALKQNLIHKSEKYLYLNVCAVRFLQDNFDPLDSDSHKTCFKMAIESVPRHFWSHC